MIPLGAVAGAGLGAACLPSPLALGPVRRTLPSPWSRPALSGIGTPGHVALTFDDGPDRTSTPLFLAELDRLGVRATFFVLGRHVADHGLLRETAAAGHEIGVHGWDHLAVSLHTPVTLRDGLVRTRDLVEQATGEPVRWYRPPFGALTATSTWAASRAGLRTVLWSAWGRDWERGATPDSVVDRVTRQLRPGGTVLLHDSDRTSAPGSWRTTLAATSRLVERWRTAGLQVGPLSAHGVGGTPHG